MLLGGVGLQRNRTEELHTAEFEIALSMARLHVPKFRFE
jgi:hypothetical protein